MARPERIYNGPATMPDGTTLTAVEVFQAGDTVTIFDGPNLRLVLQGVTLTIGGTAVDPRGQYLHLVGLVDGEPAEVVTTLPERFSTVWTNASVYLPLSIGRTDDGQGLPGLIDGTTITAGNYRVQVTAGVSTITLWGASLQLDGVNRYIVLPDSTRILVKLPDADCGCGGG